MNTKGFVAANGGSATWCFLPAVVSWRKHLTRISGRRREGFRSAARCPIGVADKRRVMIMASCSIVTPSYIRDLALAKELCVSVDRFVPAEIPHILVVPAGDDSNFSGLQSRRRRVITQELVIPWYFKRIPSPRRLIIPGIVNRPLRQAWLSPAGLISGWLVANSIVKIAAPTVLRFGYHCLSR